MSFKLFLLVGIAGYFIGVSAKRCPDGSVQTMYDPQMCYTWTKPKQCDKLVTYNKAEIECNKKGGHLASIHNATENEYLYHLIVTERSDEFYWTGINDIKDHGNRVWEDGTPVDYSNWGEDEPCSILHCGCFNPFDGKWYTKKCSEKMNYVCLIPAV